MKQWIKICAMMMFTALAVSACQKSDAPKEQSQVAAPLPPLVAPSSVDDDDGWKKYLSERIKRYIKEQGRGAKPFMYYLPNGKDRTEMTGQITDHVLRGVMSGTILAFGGPNSAEVSAMLVEAFPQASEMSLKGVKVVFIGSTEHQQAVADALTKSGAELVFLEAK